MMVVISQPITVLIDTWWNVNISAKDVVNNAIRFNRYMVECEFCKIEDWNINITVLIDTWWNVNYVSGNTALVRVTVLIDTWWNVNDFDIFRYANFFAF